VERVFKTKSENISPQICKLHNCLVHFVPVINGKLIKDGNSITNYGAEHYSIVS
jgi:hypothetical protein